ncbi:MAG: glycoside hydrolase family 2 protein [Bacteroidota bacterium]
MITRFKLSVITVVVLVMTGCQTDMLKSRMDLSDNWQFKAIDSTEWYKASVPGVVQTDLYTNQIIPDPLYGANEDAILWIEDNLWEYKTSFSLTAKQKKLEKIDLVFDGLDTYAEVFLNGKPILEANNMFRKWRLDIKDSLLEGDNELRVVFTPPITENKERIKNLGYKLPAGAETGEWQASPFTRKAPYQFGWDFAPRMVTMGIWKPVYLELWEGARIEDIWFNPININEQEAGYTAYITIHGAKSGTSCNVKVLDQELDVVLKAGFNRIAVDFTIDSPELWWPNGWGEAFLYDIPVQLEVGGTIADSTSQRLGVRTIELEQIADSTGRSFDFIVNGKKLFVKGANWSPLSMFPGQVDDSVYINRINAVKDANMNMLRVWGGGTYEKDIFYDLCDEHGILVWQDFMFANSMYPGDDDFVENVWEEVVHQVKRLRWHASLAHWNGNNEITVAWYNWGWQKAFGYSPEDSAKIWQSYQDLFRMEIPEMIYRYDPNRSYTTTSPQSNWGTPENFNYGSMHYWGVWHGPDTFDDFKDNIGRFNAEYGFQSFPMLETMNTYADVANLTLESSSEMTHQKSYVGNKKIIEEGEKYFGKVTDFADFVNKSQLTQALAYKKAIEAHRMDKVRCGGTLFWQLNDCWPGPSWSVIDYYGRKKVAFDVIKDRYKPVIVVMANDDNDNFIISIINDSLETVDAKLLIELHKADDDRLWVTEKLIQVEANAVQKVYRSDIGKILDGMFKDLVYLKATAIINDQIVDIEKAYFVEPKDYNGDYDLVGIN